MNRTLLPCPIRFIRHITLQIKEEEEDRSDNKNAEEEKVSKPAIEVKRLTGTIKKSGIIVNDFADVVFKERVDKSLAESDANADEERVSIHRRERDHFEYRHIVPVSQSEHILYIPVPSPHPVLAVVHALQLFPALVLTLFACQFYGRGSVEGKTSQWNYGKHQSNCERNDVSVLLTYPARKI